ncbi:cell division protein SepF 2 [Thermobispora bispora]|jgi:cell division inhibitor SepF|uniref:Cell division protein SepF n=1 Tax=Thermobispora bispora (strain ATCC 19993 / DSM 43833 / CBS 139.67 / JCM 10125 / KCTC 9307 / NBRC 14880 / R51) TaxID=469371 RepID=D6Y9Y7_THEBD|nr:cell division protein SepF [Thermobispora bispora]ADG88130.1 protein of unknown function DUF552 [Thermobispora bispora DSM 43833]MBO2474030.1 cell division protein SepF [Actinomycetales bacterium]MDI9582376.1 cell division protein SepF [Thermobispora sp.]QSI47983.1 cell division protein SepF [Thermobispora bispora]
MAGAMRKMAVYLGLVEDDRYEDRYSGEFADEEYGDGDAEEYEQPRRGSRASEAHAAEAAGEDAAAAEPAAHAQSPAPERRTADLARITTVHPRSYSEARMIGEHFRAGTPVIMNLTEMADSDAKRLVDFAAGLIFGLHGTIERVTNKVFLLSPANVEVTAEDKARIAERGFLNEG